MIFNEAFAGRFPPGKLITTSVKNMIFYTSHETRSPCSKTSTAVSLSSG